MRCKSPFVCRRKEIAKRIIEVRSGVRGLVARKLAKEMIESIIVREFGLLSIKDMPKKPVVQDYLLTQWVTTTLKDKYLESVWFSSYGDNWRKVALFKDEGQSDADVLYDCGYSYYYSGPGLGFGNTPYIKRNGHSIMVTWSGGLDI